MWAPGGRGGIMLSGDLTAEMQVRWEEVCYSGGRLPALALFPGVHSDTG